MVALSGDLRRTVAGPIFVLDAWWPIDYAAA
jgi:hypothetical protein